MPVTTAGLRVLALTAALLAGGCAAEDGQVPHASTDAVKNSPRAAAPFPPSAPPRSLTTLDAGGPGWSMAIAAGSVWIQVDPPVDAINRISLHSGRTTAAVPGGHQVRVGREGLWVASDEWLVRVDPITGRPGLRVAAGGELALGAGAVWVFDDAGLRRVDPADGSVAAPVGRRAARLCEDRAGLAVAFGSAWLACKEGKVVRIVLHDGDVHAIETGTGSHTLAVTSDALWVNNYDDASVSRVDPFSEDVITTPRAGGGAGITAGGGHVWSAAAGGIAQLDPGTGEIIQMIDLAPSYGTNLYELAWHRGWLWASTGASTVLRINPRP